MLSTVNTFVVAQSLDVTRSSQGTLARDSPRTSPNALQRGASIKAKRSFVPRPGASTVSSASGSHLGTSFIGSFHSVFEELQRTSASSRDEGLWSPRGSTSSSNEFESARSSFYRSYPEEEIHRATTQHRTHQHQQRAGSSATHVFFFFLKTSSTHSINPGIHHYFHSSLDTSQTLTTRSPKHYNPNSQSEGLSIPMGLKGFCRPSGPTSIRGLADTWLTIAGTIASSKERWPKTYIHQSSAAERER